MKCSDFIYIKLRLLGRASKRSPFICLSVRPSIRPFIRFKFAFSWQSHVFSLVQFDVFLSFWRTIKARWVFFCKPITETLVIVLKVKTFLLYTFFCFYLYRWCRDMFSFHFFLTKFKQYLDFRYCENYHYIFGKWFIFLLATNSAKKSLKWRAIYKGQGEKGRHVVILEHSKVLKV